MGEAIEPKVASCSLFAAVGAASGTPLARQQSLRRRRAAFTSTNAAKLNGIYPRKGTIAPGSDADIAILDPTTLRPVRAKDLHMATDYSPYEGRKLTGWPTTVISRGRIVLTDGVFHDPGEVGEALDSSRILQDASSAEVLAQIHQPTG